MTIPLMALVLVLAEPATTPKPGPEPVLAVGAFHPPFLLKTLNPERSGIEMFSTKTYVGSQASQPKRALLLDFSASYCAPCKEELPRVQALAASYAARGVQLAVVVIDEEEAGIRAMKKLLVDELALAQPVLTDRFTIVARRYGASTLPLLVVIDAAGKVSWLRAGYDADTLTALEAALEQVAAPREVPAPPADGDKKGKKPR